MWLRVVLCPCQLRAIKLSLAALCCINEYGGRRVGKMGRGASQDMSQLLFFNSNWPHGSRGGAYLHDNEEVEDQNEGGQKGPGDLVAGQEAPVQVVPADPVGADDQNHHRRQRDEHRPAQGRGKGGRERSGEDGTSRNKGENKEE